MHAATCTSRVYLFAFDMNRSALSLRVLEVNGKTRSLSFGYFMLQLSSSTNVLPDIRHRTALSVIEAANVEDVACVLLTASLSSSGAAHGAVLVVEERAFVPVVVSPSLSPAQFLRPTPSRVGVATDFVEYEIWMEKLHPEDRQQVHDDMHAAFCGQFIEPIDDSMTNTRVAFLGGKEGKWSSTK